MPSNNSNRRPKSLSTSSGSQFSKIKSPSLQEPTLSSTLPLKPTTSKIHSRTKCNVSTTGNSNFNNNSKTWWIKINQTRVIELIKISNKHFNNNKCKALCKIWLGCKIIWRICRLTWASKICRICWVRAIWGTLMLQRIWIILIKEICLHKLVRWPIWEISRIYNRCQIWLILVIYQELSAASEGLEQRATVWWTLVISMETCLKTSKI